MYITEQVRALNEVRVSFKKGAGSFGLNEYERD